MYVCIAGSLCEMATHHHPIVYEISEKLEFTWYTTSNYFTTRGQFSKVNLVMKCVTNKEGHAPAITLGDLLSFDKDMLRNPDSRPAALKSSFERLVKMLRRARNTRWDVHGITSETAFIVYLAKNILVPLFGNACFENHSYQGKLNDITGAESGNIGIGSTDTWYGSPDFRLDT